MAKVLDTPYVHFQLKEELLTATFKKGLKLTLEMAQDLIETRLEFTSYKHIRLLVFNQGVVSINKEARDYLSSEKGVDKIIAAAIVLDSPFNSFFGNFFLAVTRPKVPAKIFSTEERALKWLQQFKKQG